MNVLWTTRRRTTSSAFLLAMIGSSLLGSPAAAATTGYLVKDINGTIRSGTPEQLTAVGDELYFSATTYHNGRELWKSDGTAAGTVRLKDIYAGRRSSNPDWLADVNGTLFFTAYDVVYGRELWKSDGTSAGTTRVADIRPGASNSNPEQLTAVGNRVFFTADTGTQGREVWVSDGTSSGTHIVKDVLPGPSDSIPVADQPFQCENWETDPALVAVGNRLFFRAKPSASAKPQLWVTDGTSAGTKLVKDNLGRNVGNPHAMTASNGILLFRGGTAGNPSLWRSDGTKTGTRKISDADPFFLLDVDGTVFFRGQTWDAVNERWIRTDIWKSNGTQAGTTRVKEVINPTFMAAAGDRLYFAAGPWYPEITVIQLWSSDGTETGTNVLAEVPNQFYNLVAVANDAFFVLEDGSTYHSDGSVVEQLTRPADPCWLTDVDGTLFLTGSKPNASVRQNELWAVPLD